MSRIGKKPVAIPSGVNVAVAGQVVNIAGKLGKHSFHVPPDVAVAGAEGKGTLTPRETTKRARSLWGTSRALIAAGIRGVSTRFTPNRRIHGLVYRAQLEDKNL